ncbi:MAG: excinuclease ABC subunit UvrC [Promethearchaeota archaeon]
MTDNALDRLIHLKEYVKSFPDSCGVYIFKDSKDQVIYVGATTSLFARVSSYFTTQKKPFLTPKTPAILEQTHDIQVIPTDSVQDAFLLESDLIKQHQPRFNIRLKDDKRYPYLKITIHEKLPRVLIVRELEQDGSIYYGPYSSKRSLKRSLKFLRSQFPFCTSKQPLGEKKKIYCHDWELGGLCSGVCKAQVSVDEYSDIINSLIAFLKGDSEKILSNIEIEMSFAAKSLDFERAAILRDRIRDLRKITEKQRLLLQRDLDLFCIVQYTNLTMVGILAIENNKSKDYLVYPLVHDFPQQIAYAEAIRQIYLRSSFVPATIIIPDKNEFEDEDLLYWLTKKRMSPVIIRPASSPSEKMFLEECNALTLETLERENKLTIGAVEDLKARLRLNKRPQRIEAFDISNLGDSAAVGSMVVFHSGHPLKSHYRRFRIKTVKGQDDFAMMGEVIRRRYSSHLDWTNPDLILIDGGKGQLNAVINELENLDLLNIPILGLAKKKEEIYVPGRQKPVILPQNSSALRLLQRIRDEAHRFAIGYHRKLREKAVSKSILESIPGVGKKRKLALLAQFGSVENIKKASTSELEQIPGINAKLAKLIHQHLRYMIED